MYKLMNPSKQDHRENEGTLLLDLKMTQIQTLTVRHFQNLCTEIRNQYPHKLTDLILPQDNARTHVAQSSGLTQCPCSGRFLTFWHLKTTSVKTQCDSKKTQCHINSSAKNFQSKWGPFKSLSFAEYNGL